MNFWNTSTFWAACSWPQWQQESQPRNILKPRFEEATTCGCYTRGFVRMKRTIKRWWVRFTSVLVDLRHVDILYPQVRRVGAVGSTVASQLSSLFPPESFRPQSKTSSPQDGAAPFLEPTEPVKTQITWCDQGLFIDLSVGGWCGTH